jgi:hypothetical protein
MAGPRRRTAPRTRRVRGCRISPALVAWPRRRTAPRTRRVRGCRIPPAMDQGLPAGGNFAATAPEVASASGSRSRERGRARDAGLSSSQLGEPSRAVKSSASATASGTVPVPDCRSRLPPSSRSARFSWRSRCTESCLGVRGLLTSACCCCALLLTLPGACAPSCSLVLPRARVRTYCSSRSPAPPQLEAPGIVPRGCQVSGVIN